MTSEKAMYWGQWRACAGRRQRIRDQARESVPQLADRSVAIVTQASETARNLAEIAGLTMRGDGQEFDFPQIAEMPVRAQTRLACIQAAEVRNQAAMPRM
jgi:hypothetical protein